MPSIIIMFLLHRHKLSYTSVVYDKITHLLNCTNSSLHPTIFDPFPPTFPSPIFQHSSPSPLFPHLPSSHFRPGPPFQFSSHFFAIQTNRDQLTGLYSVHGDLSASCTAVAKISPSSALLRCKRCRTLCLESVYGLPP